MGSQAVTLDGQQINSLQSQFIEKRRHFEEVKKVEPGSECLCSQQYDPRKSFTSNLSVTQFLICGMRITMIATSGVVKRINRTDICQVVSKHVVNIELFSKRLLLLFLIYYNSPSQTFWSWDPCTFFKRIPDFKELLCTWVISIKIYCIRN